MSLISDIKESKNIRFVLGMVFMFVFMTYNDHKNNAPELTHSLNAQTQQFLLAALNLQKSPAQPVTNLYCNQKNAYPMSSGRELTSTDNGTDVAPWKEPESTKTKSQKESVDGNTPTDTSSDEEEEDNKDGEYQEVEEIAEVEIPYVINGLPVSTVGLSIPQEVIDAATYDILESEPLTYPTTHFEDILPPEGNNTGSLTLLIERPKKGS
jgi:hypothetical protein